MNATQDILLTIRQYACTGRRPPFAICVTKEQRDRVIALMLQIHSGWQPWPEYARLKGIREVNLAGVQIGSVL
jgi:hypothetical protein